jgi:glycosyltransferase involved in cell wall biosynthesis
MAHEGLRVLHVQRVKGVGGSERHLLFLLPALADAGVDVRMHVLVTDEGERFVDELRAAGVAVTTEPGGGNLNPALLPGLVREIKEFDPTIVHTHLVHADVYGQLAAAVTRRTGISSVHATPDFYRRNPYRTAGRAVGRRCARRIAISEHVGRFVRDEKLAPPERIRVVRYGMDASAFARTDDDRANARIATGVAPAEIVVGVASRLIAGKGHDVLIDAFGDAARTNPDLRLLVAGIGELRSELEARADAHCPAGSVRFLGFVEHIAEFMAACDVLAFPTQPEFGEGFGLAALEGMAAGRPVLATDVGPLPEIVVDGATGYVVPARSAAGFARAITALADDADLRRRLGEAAARRAREEFSLEAMVRGTIAVYSEVA